MALLSVVLVFILRYELQPLLGERSPFLLFTLSVMVSAWYGGLGPGLVATALGTCVGFYFFLVPTDTWNLAYKIDWMPTLLSFGIGIAISILSGSMHTARHKAEQSALALRESEARHRRIVETANEGIWLMDPHTRTTFSNQSMADMLGFSVGEMAERPVADFLFGEDVAKVETLFERWKRGISDRLDIRLKHRNGSELWTHISACPVCGDTGEFLGILVMVNDVTQHRRADNALRESEHQLRLSLRAANAATWEWCIATGRVFWSDEHYRLFGEEPGAFEPSQEGWLNRVHSDDRVQVRAQLERAIQQRREVNIDYRIVLPDSNLKWVNCRGQVYSDARGRAERVLGVVMDITERRKIETEREQIRAREMAAHALEQAARTEAARKGQELKSAMLDALAHDMKTPLTSIKAAVTCLLAGNSDGSPQRHELLGLVNEETDRLNRLVSNAIDTARLEAGALQLQRGPHYVRETIYAALKEIGSGTAGRAVNFQISGAPAPADIDFRMITQVFKQLLDNAVKYSPEGSPLTISCRSSDENVVVDVSDLGSGIATEEQSKIFDEYYRSPASSNPSAGTGMGLSIAKRIIDAHGGRIWVTSQPGTGSVFHVSLPIYGKDSP